MRLHRRRGRTETGTFLAEGPQAVREAITSGAAIEVLATPAGVDQFAALLGPSEAVSATADSARKDAGDAVTGSSVEDAGAQARTQATLLSEDALARACDAASPQAIAAICRRDPAELADVIQVASDAARRARSDTRSAKYASVSKSTAQSTALLVLLVDCQDPGNVGAVVRLADAVGAAGVIISAGSADPFGPKAVRASTGSIFHVPVVTDVDPIEVLGIAAASGITTIAAAGEAMQDVFDLAASGQLRPATMWLFGNEAHGLPVTLRTTCHHEVAIPIFGQAESLNLATAAALCLYQSALAQRR